MLPKGVEAKAYLWREAEHWCVSIVLPGWLAYDWLNELRGQALVDITTTVDLNEDNPVEFVPMPLSEGNVQCPNCGGAVPIVQTDAGENAPEVKRPWWKF